MPKMSMALAKKKMSKEKEQEEQISSWSSLALINVLVNYYYF